MQSDREIQKNQNQVTISIAGHSDDNDYRFAKFLDHFSLHQSEYMEFENKFST